MVDPYMNVPKVIDPSSRDENTIFPLDGQNFETVSDETLIALFDSAPVMHDMCGTKVVRISRSLLLEGGQHTFPCEPANMIFAATHLKDRVPAVRRVFNIKGSPSKITTCFFVMEFVQGQCVWHCWDTLEEASRADIVSQVAGIIQEMRSIKVSKPGPIGHVEVSRGEWFTEYDAGPFRTIGDLNDWFNHKLRICKHYRQAPKDTPEFAFDELVLTHMDIAPRNLILDPEGRVWLIDWALAGGYPPVFESGVLERVYQTPGFNSELLKKIDCYPEELAHLQTITYGLTVAGYA